MKLSIETVLEYQRHLPDLRPGTDGYWCAQCPWCNGQLEVGLADSETGEPTDWLCQGCAREGSLEDLGNLISQKMSRIADVDIEPESAVLSPENPEEAGLEPIREGVPAETTEDSGFSQEERGRAEEDRLLNGEEETFEEDLFSPRRILLWLAGEDHPGQVYRLAIALVLSGEGLTAKELSTLTNIRLTSVYRALTGNRLFEPRGKPVRYFLAYTDLCDSPVGESSSGNDSPGGEFSAKNNSPRGEFEGDNHEDDAS